MLPGHSVIWVDSGPNRSTGITDTRQGFMVEQADRGPLFPVKCTSLAALSSATKFGARLASSYLYDAAEAAFNEGCPAIWVSRVASSTAVQATLNLLDSAPATTLVIKAIGPGTYGNGLTVAVRTSVDDAAIGSGFQIRITEGGVILEDSPVFATKADALAWAPASGLGNAQTFTLTDSAGTGNPVRVTGTLLASGTNGGALVDADWQTALDRFTIDYGPGQVAMPGQTTSVRQLMLTAHARLRNRHALIDVADTAVIATLTAAAQAVNASPSNGGRFCSIYWPWAKVPPLSGSFGYRTIPMSGPMMGRFASAEQEGGDAGIAAAGEEQGVFRFVQGVSQDVASLTDANATLLDDAGINITRVFFGISNPVQYGNRTPRVRLSDPVWAEASGSRLAMSIAAKGDAVIRQWVHRRVSGSASLGQLQSQLVQVLEPLRLAGALYGATPQEAYDVDATSDQVNPVAQLEGGLLRAVIEYRTSPSPSTVRLELARTSITTSV